MNSYTRARHILLWSLSVAGAVVLAIPVSGQVRPPAAVPALISNDTAADTKVPSVPGTPVARAASARQIDVTWAASTDNVAVTGYVVERCQGTGCTAFTPVAVLPAATTYRDTGRSGGTVYRYRLRARDAQGNLSASSSIVTKATLASAGTAGATVSVYDSFGRLRQITVVPQ
ncbi:MAG: fibronectin type III domain-containing protein [Gammaproteobacteria bacterium]